MGGAIAAGACCAALAAAALGAPGTVRIAYITQQGSASSLVVANGNGADPVTIATIDQHAQEVDLASATAVVRAVPGLPGGPTG